MVAKKKSTGGKEQRGRVQVGKLNLSKETIKDLSPKEKSRVKGGAATAGSEKCGPSEFCTLTLCR